MKQRLGLFALIALAALIGVPIWASGHQPIGAAIRELAANPAGNPWFIATLFDTYFAFLWFWLWVAYEETSWLVRNLWLVLILALGNIAMAAYVLLQLLKLPAGAKVENLLLRRPA